MTQADIILIKDSSDEKVTKEELFKRLRDKDITDDEILFILRLIHGKNVSCCNGLFRIVDNNKNEAYINRYNAEIDRRALYKTMSVMEDKVVARIVDRNNTNRKIILDKYTLEVILLTDKNIKCFDNNIIFIKEADGVKVITGKFIDYTLIKDVKDIEKAYNNIYILRFNKSFSDSIIKYIKTNDKIYNLAKNRDYNISLVGDDESIKIKDINGGIYLVNFKENTCIDDLTDNEIDINTVLSKEIIYKKDKIQVKLGIIGENFKGAYK